MATIVDVARLSNVSRATVTRVLNNPEKVKQETRLRVEKAIRELNYSPNLSARSLVSKNSGIIGLLLPNNESGFFGSVMSIVHKKVNESGRMLVVLEGQGPEEERKAFKKLIELKCDGFILYSRAIPCSEIKEYTKDKPLVLIDRQDPECCSVYFDHFSASYQLANQLINAGHKNIGIVAGPAERQNAKARLEGALAALNDANINITTSLYRQGRYDQQFGEVATLDLLDNNPNITAIIYCGERMCAGGLKTIRMKGISVPSDISVVSFDSFNLTEYLAPHINNIVYPVTTMAELAANKVIACLKNKEIELVSEEVPSFYNSGDSILAL